MFTRISASLPLRRTLAAACLASVLPSGLFALSFEKGDFRATFDTTLSAGALYRLDDPSPSLIGVANGGTANSINADDGDLNYKTGIASTAFKATTDAEFHFGERLAAFARASYLYDYENAHEDRARTPLSQEAKDRVGERFDMLDLYALWHGEVGTHPVDVRIGRQVLSLGESTFIPNGINIVNPVDVAQLRVPGAELREAFLPLAMVNATIGLTDDLSLQAFTLLEWRRTEIEPAGSYFSTNDFASRGGKYVYLGFGQPGVSDLAAFGGVPRAADREPSNTGQWGASLRYLAPGLGDTEFGLYFAHFHSRLPVISAITPTSAINTDLTGPLTSVFISAGYPAASAAAQASGLWQLIVLSQTNPGALTPTQQATLAAASTQAAIGGAQKIAFLTAAATGRYFVEYPEGIDMAGVSFNADIGTTGISWQGEVSVKLDAPMQVDDVELLFAALGAIHPAYAANNQIGNYLGQLGQEISGYRREDMWTAQTTFTKVFGPMLGASQVTVLAEVGGVWVPGLPDPSVLRFDGSGTFTAGSQAEMNGTGNGALAATATSAFADRFSWGYTALAKIDYDNLFAGVNMTPTIAFTQDVSGNTPLPYSNFLAGRKSLTLSTEFVWQQRWSLELRYAAYFGASPRNLLADRDFASTTLKYSF